MHTNTNNNVIPGHDRGSRICHPEISVIANEVKQSHACPEPSPRDTGSRICHPELVSGSHSGPLSVSSLSHHFLHLVSCIMIFFLLTLFLFPLNSSAQSWVETEIITPTGAGVEANDNFGVTMAMDGDRMVVVSRVYFFPLDRATSNIYVYDLNSEGVWEQTLLPNPPEVDENTAYSFHVALDGDIIVVCGLSGNIHVYEPDENGDWQYSTIATLSNDGNNLFAYDVAVEGETIIAGVNFDGEYGLRAGSAFLFERDVNGDWIETKFASSDIEAEDRFGQSVDISGNRIVVGANGDDGNSNLTGAAYIYDRNPDGTMTETKLTPLDTEQDFTLFGLSVAIDGDSVLISASSEDNSEGSVYLFRLDSEGNWNGTRIQASDRSTDFTNYGAQYGFELDIDGDTFVVNANLDDDNFTDSGSLYIYEIQDNGDITETKITASDPAESDNFAFDVAISGDYVVSGAPFRDSNGLEESGALYVYRLSTGTFTLITDGTGAGTVTSTDGLIDCGSDCLETYFESTELTLNATEIATSELSSWLGDCTGSNHTINVTVDQDRECTVVFNDIDECYHNTDDCNINATCSDTNPGFACECNTGYQGNGVDCFALVPCADSSECAADASCTEFQGSNNCICDDGYEGDAVNNCFDIDECDTDNGGCDLNATCTNEPGSFSCECNLGYFGDGFTCMQHSSCGTEPCLNGGHCDSVPNRSTMPGGQAPVPDGFECLCLSGFTGDYCETDIDECLDDALNNCADSAICTNTNGGFTCECPDGFEGDPNVMCTDIDECSNGTAVCLENSECINSDGGFECRCDEGYVGDGETGCSEDICGLDEVCTVFTTSSTFNGNLGGIEGADQKCQDAADNAGLEGEYKAWISLDDENDPADRFDFADRPYVRTDGVQVSPSSSVLLTSLRLDNPINRNEFGSRIGGSITTTLTATNGNGQVSTPNANCTGWTESSSVQATFGRINETADPTWSQNFVSSCSAQRRLYCFEQNPPLPSGCGSDNECSVFATHNTVGGDMNEVVTGKRGISAADMLCRSAAYDAGLEGSYLPWISTGYDNDPITRFEFSAVPYVRTDGVRIADDSLDLLEGTGLSVPINVDEFGSSLQNADVSAVWTTVQRTGLSEHPPQRQHCGSWWSRSSLDQGNVGDINSSSAPAWTFNGNQSCVSSGRLYCFEQDEEISQTAFQETGGLVVMEAENYSLYIEGDTDIWRFMDTNPDRTGPGYMESGFGFGTSYEAEDRLDGPELVYNVNFQTTGTYYIWLRGCADNNGDDSTHIGLNRDLSTTSYNVQVRTGCGSFEWENSRFPGSGRPSINVTSPGTHQINLWQREDGARVDRILLTADPNFNPGGGHGPAESVRN